MSLDRKSRTVLLSIASNALLLAFKLAAGLATGSVSVLSEAVHSATDLVASLIAFVAVRRSDAPPDDNHHYGHGRIENLAGVFEGLVLLGVGAWVLVTATDHMLHGGELEMAGAGVAAMVAAATVNFFVSRWLLRVAKETDSRAIEAEGYNLLTDVWGAAGVALGLAAVLVTGWTILDPIIAVVIGIMILRTAFRLVSGSVRVLVDESLPEEEIELLKRLIAEEMRSEPRILGFHKLRARKSGAQRHVDFHLQLTPQTTLKEAHVLSDALEEKITESLPHSDVLVHLEDDRRPRGLRSNEVEVSSRATLPDWQGPIARPAREASTSAKGFWRARYAVGLKSPAVVALVLAFLLGVNGFLFYQYVTTSAALVLISQTTRHNAATADPAVPEVPASGTTASDSTSPESLAPQETSQWCDQARKECIRQLVAEAAP